MKTLLFAATALSATSAFGKFNLVDLEKATDITIEKFKLEYPDHLAHFTEFYVKKNGEEAKVTIKIKHHDMNESFVFNCFKTETDMECQFEEP
jgi:hypothetical protein